MRKYYLLILIFTVVSQSFSQVGVDESNPNPYSIVDMKATNKGLLIPRLSTSDRLSMRTSCQPNCPDGLMVFDTDKKSFYYLANNTWNMLNPFSAPDVDVLNKEPVSSNTTTNTVVNIATVNNDGKSLTVSGKTDFGDSIDVTGSVYASKHIRVNDDIRAADRITAGGGINSGGDITAAGFSSNVAATNVAGPVPKGGIIIWSGAENQVPSGWALCNGQNNTPNLSGRFVVASGTRKRFTYKQSESVVESTNTFTFQVNTTAGVDSVQLNLNQVPSHTHTVTISQAGSHDHRIVADDGGGGAFTTNVPAKMIKANGDCTNCIGDFEGWTNFAGSHSHNTTVSNSGGNKAHTVVPPYYVLAYIMKL